MNIKKVMTDVLKMPYYKNYAAASGAVHNIAKHEDAVETVLLKYGFSKSKRKKVRLKERDEWLEEASSCDMKDNTYVLQPCGKQQSPDFIVKEHGKVFFLECKSVKGQTKAPMYNSGVPKGKYIYIFCAERYNQTTIYFGKDVLPPKDYDLMMKIIKLHREIDEKYNPEFTNDFGINHYTRPMIKHVGGTDYFDNSRRERVEQGVLDAI